MDELARLGRHSAGIDRRLAMPPERAARERFANWARDAGYALSQDEVGNLFARRDGERRDAAPLLCGSHLDTVPTGGAYDGAYGVAAAVCALELLDARGIRTLRPIEAVAWSGEEGSRFPLGCLGSAVFAGLTTLEDARLLRDESGIALEDALADPACGLLPGIGPRPGKTVAAYLELHVEQGPVLERAGRRLGIVTAIAGQRRLRVTLAGTSGHAGTVPMEGRSDPLSAAAEVVLALERAAREQGDAVATVGRLAVEPGGTNVIPASVTFSVDVRAPHDAKIDAIENALRRSLERMQATRGVRFEVESFERRAPAPMDPRIRAALRRAIEAGSGGPALDLPSGAGHDAMCLAAIAPAGMLFVPSIGGLSHVGRERTSEADLELGVETLAAALAEVDRSLDAETPP